MARPSMPVGGRVRTEEFLNALEQEEVGGGGGFLHWEWGIDEAVLGK